MQWAVCFCLNLQLGLLGAQQLVITLQSVEVEKIKCVVGVYGDSSLPICAGREGKEMCIFGALTDFRNKYKLLPCYGSVAYLAPRLVCQYEK